jgi:hypothetical protein
MYYVQKFEALQVEHNSDIPTAAILRWLRTEGVPLRDAKQIINLAGELPKIGAKEEETPKKNAALDTKKKDLAGDLSSADAAEPLTMLGFAVMATILQAWKDVSLSVCLPICPSIYLYVCLYVYVLCVLYVCVCVFVSA